MTARLEVSHAACGARGVGEILHRREAGALRAAIAVVLPVIGVTP
jgi:hypothetical protein